jgi:aldose 1-epimerase
MNQSHFSRTRVMLLLWAFLAGSCSPNIVSEQGTGQARTQGASAKALGKGSIQKALFGHTAEGVDVHLYTLTNQNGLQVKITDYGATVTSLLTPDKKGSLGDVVLGFDSLAHYFSRRFYGSAVGRFSNRIAKAAFTLDGRTYALVANNGPNHIHGGVVGFDKVVWAAEESQTTVGPALKLSYLSQDGEEGYPGNLAVSITYTLTDDNGLRIDYEGTTDRATPVNLTNHSYFNLGAGQTEDVLGHRLMIQADQYTVVDEGLIPTGELRPVQGTPLDFTSPAPIGARIERLEKGYDHNYVLRKRPGELELAATVFEPVSGRFMEVFTTKPGVQFFVPNYRNGIAGKGGRTYQNQAGFCLETQFFPNSPNQLGFPDSILRPGQRYRHTTVYKFSVRPKDS